VICAGSPAELIAALAAETIELDCSIEEEAALLDGFAEPARRLRIGQRMMIYLENTTGLIDHIRDHDHGDRRPIIVRPTNLEDVYLSLTGTNLEGGS
jgi:hypothetical protein